MSLFSLTNEDLLWNVNKFNNISVINILIFCFADDGRSDIDNSLVVSMEINGIMYQGVLFAHNPRRL